MISRGVSAGDGLAAQLAGAGKDDILEPLDGGRLHLAFFGNSGQPETAVDSVLAVTIHGDGHIEWHTDAEAATPRAARGGEAA